jgi:hypothetical protein
MDLRLMIYDLRFCLVLLVLAGCALPQADLPKSGTPGTVSAAGRPGPAGVVAGEDPPRKAEAAAVPHAPLATGFGPVNITVLPLTELLSPSGAPAASRLHVFVALLDAFGSPIKAPAVLRFELYEYVPRSAQSKGQQVALWPNIDLTAPPENNRYWRDFLRAYEFELETQAGRDQTYILEVACTGPDGKRLSGQYTLRGSPP